MSGLQATSRPRLVSVDALRGGTVLAMILVNNPGDWGNVFAPLLHAEWHGSTPTDVVFPFFLFLVGVAIVLGLGRRLEDRAARGPIVAKIVRRSVTLVGLGLFLSGFPFGLFGSRGFQALLETWRFPGVLQRIGICYFVAALLFLAFDRRALGRWTSALLLGYWALLTLVPVPGQGAPDLDSRGGHLAGWVDRAVFGKHLWVSAKVYDPEGLLSTLPAIATTLLGILAGFILVSSSPPLEKTVRLLVRGVQLSVVGLVWGWFLPINKALWTSSYVLFTGGLAFLALGLAHQYFDVRQGRALARPLAAVGANAILAFVGTGLLARTLGIVKIGDPALSLHSAIYQGAFSSWLAPRHASLTHALVWVLGCLLIARWLEHRGWAIRI